MLKRFFMLLVLVVVASLSINLVALADNSFDCSPIISATSGDLHPPDEPEYSR